MSRGRSSRGHKCSCSQRRRRRGRGRCCSVSDRSAVGASCRASPASTDEAGRLALDVLPIGEATVSVRHPAFGAGSRRVQLPAAEVTVTLAATGTVHGRLLDGGQPASAGKYRLAVTPLGTELPMPNAGGLTGLAADGSYRLEGLAAGRYAIVVEDSIDGVRTLGSMLENMTLGVAWGGFGQRRVELEVEAGGEHELVFDVDARRSVPGSHGTVRVHATIDGRPAVGLRVRVGELPPQDIGTIDAAGGCLSGALPAQTLTFSLVPPGEYESVWQGDATVAPGRETRLEIALAVERRKRPACRVAMARRRSVTPSASMARWPTGGSSRARPAPTRTVATRWLRWRALRVVGTRSGRGPESRRRGRRRRQLQGSGSVAVSAWRRGGARRAGRVRRRLDQSQQAGRQHSDRAAFRTHDVCVRRSRTGGLRRLGDVPGLRCAFGDSWRRAIGRAGSSRLGDRSRGPEVGPRGGISETSASIEARPCVPGAHAGAGHDHSTRRSGSMRILTSLFSPLSMAFLASAPALAQIHVDDDAPNDPGPNDPTISDPLEDGSSAHPYDSIQEAIDAIVFASDILVEPGRYAGPGNGNITTAKSVQIRGRRGADETIIDLENAAPFLKSTGSFALLEGLDDPERSRRGDRRGREHECLRRAVGVPLHLPRQPRDRHRRGRRRHQRARWARVRQQRVLAQHDRRQRWGAGRHRQLEQHHEPRCAVLHVPQQPGGRRWWGCLV